MVSLPDVEREELELDVVIIGGGPAGLAAGYHLMQLINKAKESGQGEAFDEVSVAILEKGTEIGAHGISGAVMDPRGIRELMPDWLARGCPIEAEVGEDALWYMTESMRIAAPILPPNFNNHGNYVMSLAQFCRWMGEKAMEAGVDVFPEFPAAKPLYEDRRVVGVRTSDKGVGKDGNQKGNFEAGVDIKAKVVICAEGPRGTVTKQLAHEYELYSGKNPQVYALGVKELWEVPDGRFEAGRVIHTMGWPNDMQTFGGSFIYGMKDNIVDVGFVVGLDGLDPTMDTHDQLQRFKLHPEVRKILAGGKLVEAGAKAIPEGGYFSMPKLFGDGFLLIGDSGGFLNGARLKGIHLAIKSGMLAAETVFDALKAGDYSSATLSGIETRFETSWARDELHRERNFHQGFENGQIIGMVNVGLGMVTGGRGFGVVDRLEAKAGHEKMMRIRKFFGSDDPKPPERMKYDNIYTFDKVTNVYHGGVKHEENQPAHLLISDTEVCITRCTEEYGNPCLHFCPASVYEPKETEDGRGKVPFLNFTNCFHCKTCDILDPYQVITWVPPEGGGGPEHKKA